jgi:hypothetical protein
VGKFTTDNDAIIIADDYLLENNNDHEQILGNNSVHEYSNPTLMVEFPF